MKIKSGVYKDTCVYDSILKTFKTPFDAYFSKRSPSYSYYGQKMTYAWLANYFGKNIEEDPFLTPQELAKFGNEFRLNIIIYEHNSERCFEVTKHDNPNHHISPHTMYLRLHGNHVVVADHNPRSMSEKCLDVNVTPEFYSIPSYQETNVTVAQSMEEIFEIIKTTVCVPNPPAKIEILFDIVGNTLNIITSLRSIALCRYSMYSLNNWLLLDFK